jgi:hypothetical protein
MAERDGRLRSCCAADMAHARRAEATSPSLCSAARGYAPCMDLVLPLILSGMGVAVAAVAFYSRDRPDWQRNMTALMALAIGQVVLGAVSWVLLSR